MRGFVLKGFCLALFTLQIPLCNHTRMHTHTIAHALKHLPLPPSVYILQLASFSAFLTTRTHTHSLLTHTLTRTSRQKHKFYYFLVGYHSSNNGKYFCFSVSVSMQEDISTHSGGRERERERKMVSAKPCNLFKQTSKFVKVKKSPLVIWCLCLLETFAKCFFFFNIQNECTSGCSNTTSFVTFLTFVKKV